MLVLAAAAAGAGVIAPRFKGGDGHRGRGQALPTGLGLGLVVTRVESLQNEVAALQLGVEVRLVIFDDRQQCPRRWPTGRMFEGLTRAGAVVVAQGGGLANRARDLSGRVPQPQKREHRFGATAVRLDAVLLVRSTTSRSRLQFDSDSARRPANPIQSEQVQFLVRRDPAQRLENWRQPFCPEPLKCSKDLRPL